jgi:hypothetical protein
MRKRPRELIGGAYDSMSDTIFIRYRPPESPEADGRTVEPSKLPDAKVAKRRKQTGGI